jgi:RHS repeat-associated protein
VRRVFASTSSATAYGYDPYGVPLQATAPTTDFVYAGMFFNADSGLYLTNYRAFDSVVGRWLSRDPIGETSDDVGNLYPYVGGNPVLYLDPSGLQPMPDPNASGVPGGPWEWSPNPQNSRGGQWMGPRPPGGGPRATCTYAQPSPINPDPYWKVYIPPPPGSARGTKAITQRYDIRMNPITPNQSHPGQSPPSPPKPPGGGGGGPVGGGTGGGGVGGGSIGGGGVTDPKGKLWK